MNKNKLDSMLKTIDTFKHKPIYIGNCSLVDIATMLRQQQAEIKELKAKLQLHDAMDNQCASLMQQFRKAQREMREVNGDLRMTIEELIEELKKLPADTEVSGMNSLKYWIERKAQA